MKFPTIPRHFLPKTFGEVFNRLLNAYRLIMKMLRRCFVGRMLRFIRLIAKVWLPLA